MRALIIEDELPAANRLKRLIRDIDPDMHILDVLDSIESSVAWLRNNPAPDLLFCDIHLADGLSFEIFTNVDVDVPVVFTTAYDAYAIQAFQVNSVDYLLKPIETDALEGALNKYRKRFAGETPAASANGQGVGTGGAGQAMPTAPDKAWIQELLDGWGKPRYRERFLVKRGERLDYIPSDKMAYCYSDDGLTHLVAQDGHRDLLDRSLEDIAAELDPATFFRASRKCIVALSAIGGIHKYFSGRLKLDLKPDAPFDVLVSRERVDAFQAWLDR
jgi:DNA-binding LytR/AlgR family response regulator